MPDRYWVGGTASWDGTAGTKWSETSGGPGGASVPTSADDVFFTNLSTGTCTIATGNTGARSINCTGFTGTITGTAAITVSGSVTLVAAMTYTHTGTMTFNGTGTLTTAGKTFSGVTVSGAGITVTLNGPLTTHASGDVRLTNGTFTTNNQNINCGDSFSYSGSLTATFNLGSSTITVAGQFSLGGGGSTTNLTFNAGTSTIVCNGASQIYCGSKALHNMTINNNVNGVFAMLSFNNLTISPGFAVFFDSNATVNGIFTCAGSSITNRVLLGSFDDNRYTITAASVSANNCDFMDIGIAGAAAPISPANAGNGGNNSGINFPSAKTVYRVGNSTSWIGTNSWALTSGGAGSDNNYPLLQDTAIIDNSTTGASLSLSSGTIAIGGINCSSRSTPFTLTNSGTIYTGGSLILSTSITTSGTGDYILSSDNNLILNTAGRTVTNDITLKAPEVLLSGNVFSSARLFLDSGRLNLNDFNYRCTRFSAIGNLSRGIDFGTSGSITVTGSSGWSSTSSGFTITGTPVVNISPAATSDVTTSTTAGEPNSISFNITSGTSVSVSGHFRNLNFTGFSGTLDNAARTIFGDLTLSTGMTLTAGTSTTTFASTSATPRTIRTNGRTLDFPLTFNGAGGTFRLLDALTMGSTRTLTHTNGTIDLNGFNLTVGTAYTTATGTKNLTFNGGTLTCATASTTAFNNAQPTNFTTTAGTGTGTINMTAATAKTFVGGGSTYNCTLNNGGAGALTITGNNTFTTLSNSVQPTSFLFTAGTTTTLTNWNINGTAGNLVTIGSPTAASHTLSKSSGTVTGDFLSISRSTATGGASWNATNSTDGGNNTGWIFGAAAAGTGNFFSLFL